MSRRSDLPVFVNVSPNGGRLYRASDALRAAERALSREVLKARAAGASWDRIAIVTGINRETLRRKYGSQNPSSSRTS